VHERLIKFQNKPHLRGPQILRWPMAPRCLNPSLLLPQTDKEKGNTKKMTKVRLGLMP